MKCPNCPKELTDNRPVPGKPGRAFYFCDCTPGRPVLKTSAPAKEKPTFASEPEPKAKPKGKDKEV